MIKKLINYTEIDSDGEVWEFFARDFLQELGFFIESTPDRGPDGKKDILLSEQLEGNLNKYKFKWLVSCKHFAKSNRSVSENDEINIQERLESFGADGFIGFYSTLPSSGLNNRLSSLKNNKKIKDYRVFDSKLIENYLIRIGYSKLIMRYFPESYKNIKPIHLVLSEYKPLHCPVCDKDLIESLNYNDYNAVFCRVNKYCDETGVDEILDVYCACKGDCDRKLEVHYLDKYQAVTQWEDISDLIIPFMFLRHIFSTMNLFKNGKIKYTDEVYEKEKDFIVAMSQKVLREMTEKEKERVEMLLSIPTYI